LDNIVNAKLLIIDPQNDFCDLAGAALPVPGANADMLRLAALMRDARGSLADVIVTLDSHASVSIERTTFWTDAEGRAVAPFTQIAAEDLRAGHFLPRDPARRAGSQAYLDALERGGRFRLIVWPVHCVLGTWGHNIHEAVSAELAEWEQQMQRPALRVLKGLNPMTEQYSAVRAEVPDELDPGTQTNRDLIERTRPGDGLLLVAGEAASHCVAATLEHLLMAMSAEEKRRLVILRDCMSPVASFEAQADKFFDVARAQGARIMTSQEALAGIRRA
jgi:nicotinamidase-related amidase